MDSTIETLEIIIKAKIDDALKNIQAITDEVKKRAKNSATSMNELTESSRKATDSLKPLVQSTKKQMQQYEKTIKETSTKVNKQLSDIGLKSIDIDFNTENMNFTELETKMANLKSSRDELLSSKPIELFSDADKKRLDDLVFKILEVEEAMKNVSNKSLTSLPSNKATGPALPTVFDKPVNAQIKTGNSRTTIDKLKGYTLQAVLSMEDAFKGLGKVITNSVTKATKKARDTVNNLKTSFKSINAIYKKIGNINSKTLSGIVKSTNNGIKSIKKFALSLLSIQTIYALLSKASQAYLNFDTQLNDSIQNSWNTLGSLLAPILEYIASLFSKITSSVAAFIKALTGVDLVARANAKALNSQAKASKEANKQLAGIDDINVLTTSTSNGTGDSTPTITTEDVDISLFDGILARIREIVKAWKEGNWGEVGRLLSKDFTDLFTLISTKIKSIDFSSIGANVSEFLTNIDFSGILTSLVSIFGEAVLGLQEFILAIDWATVFQNLSQGLIDAINLIGIYITQINWSELGQKLSEVFTSIDWLGIGNAILNALWSGISGIVKLFLAIDWGSVGKTVSEAVKGWIDTILQKFAQTDWEQLGKDIFNAIYKFLVNVDWLGLAKKILLLLASALSGLGGLVVGAFKGIWEKVKTGAINAFNGIIKVFKSIPGWFKSVFTTAWTNVKNVFSTGGKIFVGIKDGIVSAFKTIVNKIISGINKVIKIPFDGINKALKKIKNISILGAKPFDFINTISVPKIPTLATGNVATKPTLAIFAEYANARSNPEITAPQSIIRDTLRQALDEYSFNNNASGQHVTVQFGVEKIVDEFIDEINKRIQRRGVSVWREA